MPRLLVETDTVTETEGCVGAAGAAGAAGASRTGWCCNRAGLWATRMFCVNDGATWAVGAATTGNEAGNADCKTDEQQQQKHQ